ncbi:MAG: hypothetical protein JW940_17575 [Polyangiaceae bacterium]|nr:hypothetical protein [Polyangiaceae bacterium]
MTAHFEALWNHPAEPAPHERWLIRCNAAMPPDLNETLLGQLSAYASTSSPSVP